MLVRSTLHHDNTRILHLGPNILPWLVGSMTKIWYHYRPSTLRLQLRSFHQHCHDENNTADACSLWSQHQHNFFWRIEHIRIVLHCIYPCVPTMVVDKNYTVFMSSERGLARPKEIKVNNLIWVDRSWFDLGWSILIAFPCLTPR